MTSKHDEELKNLKRRMDSIEAIAKDQKAWNEEMSAWRTLQIEAQKQDEEIKKKLNEGFQKVTEIYNSFVLIKKLIVQTWKILKPLIKIVTLMGSIGTAVYLYFQNM